MCVSTIFLSDMYMSVERAKLFGMYETIGKMSPAEQADLTCRWPELDTRE
jgi:membrane dipeptidase